MCCSVLQVCRKCVAGVLQDVEHVFSDDSLLTYCCSVLHCVASVLQVCCSVL